MAATVQINEYNGAGETKTANISTGHFRGATDSPNLADPVDDPIATGANSYEKWWKAEVTAMGGSSQLDTWRIYLSAGSVPGSTDLLTSADSGTPSNPSYTQPTTSASSEAVNAMPVADPGVAEISGTLTGTGETGYVVNQVQVGGGETSSNQSGQLTFVWREIV